MPDNVDIPNQPNDYVHRIGRTGRAGRKGVAISIKNAKLLEDTRLDYHESMKLFTNIANQMLSLERKGWMIPYFSPQDILLLKDGTYAYIGVNKIIRGEEIDLTLGKGEFLSPEITDVKAFEVNKRSGWYSLAALVTFYLTGKKNNPLKHLQTIYGTKLYWTLIEPAAPASVSSKSSQSLQLTASSSTRQYP